MEELERLALLSSRAAWVRSLELLRLHLSTEKAPGQQRSCYYKLRKLKGLTLKDTWELGDVLVRAAGAGEGLQNATFHHSYK